jgi:hypothetical protein
MTNEGFTTRFSVDQTPQEAFDAINNVRGWWSENVEGVTNEVGKEFRYRHRDIHRCTIEVAEFVPGVKVVWRVRDNQFNFTRDESEWKGTEIHFEIVKTGRQTEIRFAHLGLVPAYECFDVCSNAWGSYINGSLRSLIATGHGAPNAKE